MKLTKDQVLHVATLARLELTDEEREKFSIQLSAVLDNIDKLNEIDTDNVEPTSPALDIVNVFRDDKAQKRFAADSWKSNAPAEDYGHFRVPKIIEN